MATYRQVKGYSVKSVTSNPDNVKEMIFYNLDDLLVDHFELVLDQIVGCVTSRNLLDLLVDQFHLVLYQIDC